MSATAVAPATKPAPAAYRRNFGGDVRSEWIKLRTLKSTWWVSGSTIVSLVLIALLASTTVTQLSDEQGFGDMDFNPMELVTSGAQLAQIVLAVLGVLVITNEYSSGMIRSTLTATPTRTPALLAKALVLTLLSLVVAVVGLGLSWAVSYPVLSNNDMAPTFGEDGSTKIFVGAVVVMILVALMSFGFGSILRHTAGAIFTVVALLLVIPGVLSLISNDIVDAIEKYMPLSAATAFTTTSEAAQQGMELPSPTVGLLVLIAWAVVPIAVGAILLKRRDA